MRARITSIHGRGGAAAGLTLSAAVIVAVASAVAVAKEPSPADPAARYTMSPLEGGGFVRLDTVTGQMSRCTRRDQQWTCTDMADQGRGLAEEVERLRAENNALKADIRRLEDITSGDSRRTEAERHAEAPGGPLDPPDAGPGGGQPPAGKFKLPSERDVDQAIDYMQRLYKKFRAKIKEFDSGDNGTPL